MILRFSAVVQRHRRGVLLTAMVVGALAVTAAIRSPSEPSAALVAVGAVAVLAMVIGAVVATVFRWETGPRFEIDESARAFRTPRSATPVFVVLFLSAAMALFAEVGGWSWAHGDRDAGWIAVMALLGVPSLLLAAAIRRGHGIAMTPEGIHADRGTGTVTLPWTALSAAQPRPATPPTQYYIDLAVARADRVARTGIVLRPHRVTFEGTPPAFVTAAIRHYAAHPVDRPLIGTQAEHRRLVELLALPADPVEPPPSRRRIAIHMAVGILVFAAAVAGDVWVDTVIGRNSVLGLVSHGVRTLVSLLALHFFAAAVRGVRARRRPAPQDVGLRPPPPAPPQVDERHSPLAPPATRPAWARDVTDHR